MKLKGEKCSEGIFETYLVAIEEEVEGEKREMDRNQNIEEHYPNKNTHNQTSLVGRIRRESFLSLASKESTRRERKRAFNFFSSSSSSLLLE